MYIENVCNLSSFEGNKSRRSSRPPSAINIRQRFRRPHIACIVRAHSPASLLGPSSRRGKSRIHLALRPKGQGQATIQVTMRGCTLDDTTQRNNKTAPRLPLFILGTAHTSTKVQAEPHPTLAPVRPPQRGRRSHTPRAALYDTETRHHPRHHPRASTRPRSATKRAGSGWGRRRSA